MNYFLTEDKCKLVKSKLLSAYPELISACSTRLGGVSSGIHKSMNLGFYNGDEKEKVSENYRIITNTLGTSPERIVLGKQTHKNYVKKVNREDAGKGVIKPVDYDDIDALITNEKGLVLCILTADCVPVSIYDPVNKAIGLAHSGWRGTVAEITAETIKAMTKEFSSNPKDLILSTGPCICKKCYEVSEEVAINVRKVYNDTSDILFPHKEDDKYQLDLTAAIKSTALNSGLLAENIEIQELCTNCNPELLFSHRATGGKRGTLATFLGLKD